MSGLAAIISFDGRDVSNDAQRMVAAVPHRCTSGVLQHKFDSAVLAHLCTHVTEPTDPDPQLVLSLEPAVVVVADARIDNRTELVATLGQAIAGDAVTDADLILAAYRKWGVDIAAHLLGDFVFVIFDQAQRRVLAARDSMALRPLYLRIEPHRRVLLASEAKQIVAASGVPRRINDRALAHHLVNRFDPLDWSFYEGVEILEPGHSITIEESGSRRWRHWDFDASNEISYRTEDEYAEHLRELLIEAVRARVDSDRPTGVLLSGGMDSGTAAGVASWLRSHNGGASSPIRAYTWDFGDLTQSDERHISRHLIDHFGMEETQIPVAHLGPLAEYPRYGPDADTPFLGAFQPPFERSLEVAAADGCGLVMSGDRGDLIAGAQIVNYPRMVRSGRWRQLKRELQRHRAATDEAMGTILLRDLLRPGLRRLRDRARSAPLRTRRPEFPSWMRKDFADRTGVAVGLGDIVFGGLPIGDELREERRRLILQPLHMRGMIWTNRTHAVHGLEFADPWSDRRLAEFVVAIPPQIINRPDRNDKVFVKKATVGILPETFLATASKTLPTPLYERGLFERGTATVAELFRDSQAAARGYIDEASALAAYDRVRWGGAEPFPIWRTICVEMWLRAHWAEV